MMIKVIPATNFRGCHDNVQRVKGVGMVLGVRRKSSALSRLVLGIGLGQLHEF